MKMYWGIDPGMKGFHVFVDEIGQHHESIPIYVDPKIKNITFMHNTFEDIISKYEQKGYKLICILEDIRGYDGTSKKSAESMMHTVGAIEMALIAYGVTHIKVPPKEWQKEMHKGVPLIKKMSSTKKTQVKDTKAMSIIAAQRIFPGVSLGRQMKTKLSTVPDDNLVDALLIAEYGRRQNY